MRLYFSPFAGWTGDRKGVRRERGGDALVNAKATRTVDGDGSVGTRPLGARGHGRVGGDRLPPSTASCRAGIEICGRRYDFYGNGTRCGGDAIRSSCR